MAIDEYRHAIDLEPDYPDAHLNLGLGYADEGRFEGRHGRSWRSPSAWRRTIRCRAMRSPPC